MKKAAIKLLFVLLFNSCVSGTHTTLLPLPIYDIAKNFEKNMQEGPFFNGAIPKRIWQKKTKWQSLFGYEIASPIGIAACPFTGNLTGANLASQLGFDIITYKTVRYEECEAYPFPNIGYVNIQHQLQYKDLYSKIQVADKLPTCPDYLAITNSIGNASCDPKITAQTISNIRKNLQCGQVLIVSIYGTQTKYYSVAQDFANTASFVADAGAQVIEANISCPNVNNSILYTQPTMVADIIKHIKKVCPTIPLIIKVGPFPSEQLMRTVLVTAATAGAAGICGINSVPMRVVNKDDKYFFGDKRIISGVSGTPIRNLALSFVRTARNIIDQEKLDLVLFATGGITKQEHFNLFFDAGADIALSATGALWNPYLALEFHQSQAR